MPSAQTPPSTPMKRAVKTLGRTVVDWLPDRYLRWLFCEMAHRLHVSLLEIPGRQGSMRGYLDDQVFREYVRTGTWSTSISALVKAGFERHSAGTFLDIGANIGLTLVPIARDPRITCLAFEPDPTNFELLRVNVAGNCPGGNARLFNVAIFDREGPVRLELSRENFGDHRVRNVEPATSSAVFRENDRRTISVEARPLDGLLDVDAMPQPLIIKVDSQGAEQQIYSGGRRAFARAAMLILEFWPYGIERMGGDAELLIQYLEGDFKWGSLLRRDPGPKPDEFLEIRQVAASMRRLSTRKVVTFTDINAHDLVFVKDRAFLA